MFTFSLLLASHNMQPESHIGGEDAPTIQDGLEQLGLRLVTAKGPVERLWIDHIEKPEETLALRSRTSAFPLTLPQPLYTVRHTPRLVILTRRVRISVVALRSSSGALRPRYRAPHEKGFSPGVWLSVPSLSLCVLCDSFWLLL